MEKLKAYHLTESAMPQTVAIIFGRFNPPHKGHKHAWETASQVADQWYVGTNKSTVGPEDPLPFEVKIEAMKAIMPEVEDHLVAEQSWWTLATYVFKKYGGVPGRTLPITLLVITDEPYVVPGLLKSNGQVSNHGEYSFQDIKLPFDSIDVAKKHLRISSATALRNAVAAGDRHGFAQAAGVSADTLVAGHKFFDLVAHYLIPHREAQAAKDAAKAEKEKQKAEKLAMKQQPKAKGPAQELAEIKQRLDPKCWKGKHKEGTKVKGGIRVNNCVPNESINERSTTEKQARTMAAAAHDPKFAKKLGIKQSVAKEFNQADKGTKQLSNAMKHKRVSEALEELYEAKARESLKQFEHDAIPGMTVYDSLNNSNSYTAYRFGVALAPSPDFTDMAKKSALANSFAMIDYTDADSDIRKGAEKSMGVRSSSSTSAKSKELPSTNKVSPVAGVKRNKYGI
jgi:cytidyltransferase-like protein